MREFLNQPHNLQALQSLKQNPDATVASSLKMFLDDLRSEEEDSGFQSSQMQSKREATHRNHPHTFGVTQEVKDLVDRKMYLQAQYGSDSEYKTGYNLSSTSP